MFSFHGCFVYSAWVFSIVKRTPMLDYTPLAWNLSLFLWLLPGALVAGWRVQTSSGMSAHCCWSMLVVAYLRSLDLHFHSFVHVMSGAHGETRPPPLQASVTLILSLSFPGSDVFQEHLWVIGGKAERVRYALSSLLFFPPILKEKKFTCAEPKHICVSR